MKLMTNRTMKAEAIVAAAKERGLSLADAQEFDAPTGRGVTGTVDGKRIALVDKITRADVAALTERWAGDPTLTWIGLCRATTMAEGDIYRLLSRTLEYLSQIQTLKATHPGLAETAARAITVMRRGVLEELP